MGRDTIQWNEKNDIDLLAHLKFVIEKILKESGRYGTTEEVLRSLESEQPEPKRTRDQIDRRLRKLWNDHNPNPGPWNTYEDIYRFAIDSLRTLASGLKDQIEEERGILEKNQKLKIFGTPRKTRSGPQTFVAESSSGKVAGVASSERTPTKSNRKRKRQPPQHSTSKWTKRDMITSKRLTENAPILQRRKYKPSWRTATTRPTIIANSETTTSGPQSFVTFTEEDNRRSPTLNIFQHPETSSQSFFYTDVFSGSLALDYDDPNSEKSISDTKIVNQGNETLLDLFSDNEYFRKQLSKSEAMQRYKVESTRVRETLQVSRLPEIIEERNKTIAELKQQLKDQAFVQQLLGKEIGKQGLLNRGKIKSSHEDMRKNIMGLSVLEDTHYTPDEIKGIDSKDLSALTGRVLSEIAQLSPPNDVSLSLDAWVKSLTGAAVCEWVFKETYQCAAMMNSPLFDAYRRIFSTICTEETLRTVDTVAHQFVVDNRHFKNTFLPRTADRLAKRLSTALAPLMKDKCSTGEEDFEENLGAIFQSALNIKMLGMTANHIFEFIWPSRSAFFEGESMVEELLRNYTNGTDDSERKAKKVILTLVPGLRVYSYERQFVDYCNFTSSGEEGLGISDLVTRAVVVTQ